MPQVNISLSDEIHNLLVEMADLTGITKSSLAAEYVRRGLYEDAKSHKEVLLMQKEKFFSPVKKEEKGDE
ncbi:MAG: hypothetical protein F6K47_40360 [Symploca sp. SIO2E6]|nr:hypothetical protein [Symploca sp. SIO2E6]